MAVKHLLAAYKGGEFKFAAFGRWDGTPTHYGTSLLKSLSGEVLEAVRMNLDLIDAGLILSGIDAPIHANDMVPDTAHDRDSGSILELVCGLKSLTAVPGCLQLAVDSFCEWVYVLNYDTNQVEVYSQYALNEESNIFDFLMSGSERAEKIGLVKAFSFDALPDAMNIVNPYDPQH